MNFVELNKLSNLHNGESVIFCKTDFVFEEFNYIKNINWDVILITGNSDYPITDEHLQLAPYNIKKWYAQNALSNNEKLIPIPIGLENKLPCYRPGHGVGYFERVTEKENLLSRNIHRTPKNKIYANFNIETNFQHRTQVKEKCIKSPHIDWEEPNLTLLDFFDKILDYEMVVCPAGNGLDTHRLWEVLYSGRVPITIKMGDYKLYKLYEKCPIIILNHIDELHNEHLIINKYYEVKDIKTDILNIEYWVNMINKI